MALKMQGVWDISFLFIHLFIYFQVSWKGKVILPCYKEWG